MRDRSEIAFPHVLLVGLVVVLCIVLLVATGTSSASFSVFNSGWDGVSDLRSETTELGAEEVIVTDAARYGSVPPDGSVALIFSPSRPYEFEDQRRIGEFVESGGTLVIAEDFGSNSNELLDGIGANARFDGRPLRDEQYNFRVPSMPIADNGSRTVITDATTTLALNHGTAIEPNGSTVGLTTSEVAYLDDNRNRQLDQNETVAAYPVVTVEEIGDGTVIAVGDPSIFLNAMLDRRGNHQFSRDILNTDRVLFDVSHASSSPPPLAYGLSVIQQSHRMQSVVSVAGILGILFVVRLSRPIRRTIFPGTDSSTSTIPDTLTRSLANRYPQWGERRISYVIAMMTPDSEDDTDE